MAAAMARIAVSGIGGETGQGILKALRAHDESLFVVGFDHQRDCAGFHMVDAHATVPDCTDESFVFALIDHLIKHPADLYLSGVDLEVGTLSDARETIEQQTGCRVVLPPVPLVDAAVDKLKTAHWLEANDLPFPKTQSASEVRQSIEDGDIAFPLIAKPRHGYGSRDIEKLDNLASLQEHLGRAVSTESVLGTFCYQQFLDGAEYTAELLFDDSGELRDMICTERLLRDGRTVCCWPAQGTPIRTALRDFGAKTNRMVGPLNLQFRFNELGEPTVFEINPRFSGSTSMRMELGYNSPLRYVLHALEGRPIEQAPIENRKVYRVFGEFAVPLGLTGP